MIKKQTQLARWAWIGLVILLLAASYSLAKDADPFSALKGQWRRTDNGHRLQISGVDESGQIEASYFTPDSVKVLRARALEKKGKVKIEWALTNDGRPGISYNLVYIAEKDLLFGYCYGAVSEQFKDVVFTRMKQ